MECRAKSCSDGSPGTFVFDHCRYSGYVAEELLALLPKPVRQLLPPETPFLVSLHDIGKVSPGFEGKYFLDLLEEKAPKWAREFVNGGVVTNHATIGAKALKNRFSLEADHPLVRAVAAHHGFAPEHLAFTRDGMWQDERIALVRALEKEFGLSKEWTPSDEIPVDLLAGITCVSDWIASDESFFPPDKPPLTSDEGRNKATRALAECGFRSPTFRQGLSLKKASGLCIYAGCLRRHSKE